MPNDNFDDAITAGEIPASWLRARHAILFAVKNLSLMRAIFAQLNRLLRSGSVAKIIVRPNG
jgi:hypothetical protein